MNLKAAHGIALINTRTTFQRIHDARFFTGCLRSLERNVFAVACPQEPSFEQGQRFAFHVFGSGYEAFFFANFRSTTISSNPLSSHEYLFHIEGEMRLTQATQEPRFVISDVTAEIHVPGFRHCDRSQVCDISSHGLGILSSTGVKKGDQVEVTIAFGNELIQATAEVKYCVKDKTKVSQYRVGLRLGQMDRVSAMRWKQLYERVLEGSRYVASEDVDKAS